MKRVKIVKLDLSTGNAQKKFDYVAEEKPLHIYINGKHYATIMCSPSKLKELAVGHLLTQGIAKAVEEIAEINLKNEGTCQIKLKPKINIEGRIRLAKPYSRIISSACGSASPEAFVGKTPKATSNLKVKAQLIKECVKNLNVMAETFRKTGGVHVAAIYKSDGTIVASAEDVGRHNAVDKAIGTAALNKADFNSCFLALSGRLTADILLKVARTKIPIVASIAAALDSGIEIAKQANITLIGFARGNRMNIYSFPERILS
ncbi:MAG: formate dehydrogenase accessory sulfurtransferase FdhD [Candidatus Bathyarchaeales archaeon]